MSELRVREPLARDSDAIARVQNRAWEQAYAHLLPERFWDADALSQREQMWGRALSRPEVRSWIRVAESSGSIIGFASAGRPQDADVDVHVEVYTCYVLGEHYGTGVAGQMLTELIGEKPASLWVFENNPRAVRFYQKHGFTADGAAKDLGEEENDETLRGIREIRMVRPGTPQTRPA